MKKYFDPQQQPPLPLVEIPEKLNPFRKDGVRIYAKMMTALPCQNVKALPALNMIQRAGSKAKRPIFEPSSGSTVTSLAMISRVLNDNEDITALVSNKTEVSRLQQLRFFGLKVELYGGPAQPNVSDPRGAVEKARLAGLSDPCRWNPGQYTNPANYEAHIRWTGPQLMAQLPEINVFAAGMGSAGCLTGTAGYLKRAKPGVTALGVCNLTGDSIPGPRPYPLFHGIEFPWTSVCDDVEEIPSKISYRQSLSLSREGLICGPSSGMCLEGLLRFLEKRRAEGTLHHLAEPSTQEISCVFLCCDLPYQYMDKYFDKLDDADFHPVANDHLRYIDTDYYDPRWELTKAEVVEMIAAAKSARQAEQANIAGRPRFIDLRSGPNILSAHSDTHQVPLPGLSSSTPSPFDDVSALEKQWYAMRHLLKSGDLTRGLPKTAPLVVVCHNGESSRLACSMLRGRGYQAFSAKGGLRLSDSFQQ